MLKRIDFNQPVIPANGKEYKYIKELPIARFKELDKMEEIDYSRHKITKRNT